VDHHDARNRAIDRVRREASCADRHAQAALVHFREQPGDEGPVQDDRLRLIFTCCHPALAMAPRWR
jgi:RNA polymerase sigma-70 factor (ECF subfamily)